MFEAAGSNYLRASSCRLLQSLRAGYIHTYFPPNVSSQIVSTSHLCSVSPIICRRVALRGRLGRLSPCVCHVYIKHQERLFVSTAYKNHKLFCKWYYQLIIPIQRSYQDQEDSTWHLEHPPPPPYPPQTMLPTVRHGVTPSEQRYNITGLDMSSSCRQMS